jgi:hypothetical protein
MHLCNDEMYAIAMPLLQPINAQALKSVRRVCDDPGWDDLHESQLALGQQLYSTASWQVAVCDDGMI